MLFIFMLTLIRIATQSGKSSDLIVALSRVQKSWKWLQFWKVMEKLWYLLWIVITGTTLFYYDPVSVCHKPVFCQNSWIGWIRSAISIEMAKWDWAGLWHRGYLGLSFILEGNLGIYKNKITALWSLVPNSELSWFLANVHYMLSTIRLSSVCL